MHLLSSQINFIPAISPCEIIEIIDAHIYMYIYVQSMEGNVGLGFSVRFAVWGIVVIFRN